MYISINMHYHDCCIIVIYFFNFQTGADISRVKAADAGLLISDKLKELLSNWSYFVPNGLEGVGYGSEHLDALVKGTLPQRKVIDVAPRQPTPDDFYRMLDNSMKLF